MSNQPASNRSASDNSLPNAFLAPCSGGAAETNLKRTIETPVPSEDYRGYTTKEFGPSVHLWGMREAKQSTWGKMEPGDWLLFYTGNFTYSYAARVRDRERNPTLAAEVWSPRIGSTPDERKAAAEWEYVIYLDDPVSINLPSQSFHDRLGYNDEYPQGFRRVTHMDELRAEYGSLDELVRQFERDTTDRKTAESAPDEGRKQARRATLRRQLQQGNDVLLYGPAKSGKRDLAVETARSWVANDAAVSVITLHDKLSYEDLIESEHPDGEAETHSSGMFKAACDRASEAAYLSRGDPPNHVIVLANVGAVSLPDAFGEVLPLLCDGDTRGEDSVALRYSADRFEIPENVWLIGTLSSTDRRLRDLHPAFQRHVRCITVEPDYESLRQTAGFEKDLQTVLNETNEDDLEHFQAASILSLRLLNETLYESADAIGHRYLVDAMGSEQSLLDAWQYDIFPQMQFRAESIAVLEETLTDLLGELNIKGPEPGNTNEKRYPLANPRDQEYLRELVVSIASTVS